MQEADPLLVFTQDQPYSPAHIFLVLDLISRELIVGRYGVEKETLLSNSAARSLLEHLAGFKLIQPVQRKGHSLTALGERFFMGLRKRLPFNGQFSLPRLVPEPSYLVQIREPQFLSRNGLMERDLAVRYGARGGVTLLYEQRGFYVPGIEQDKTFIDPELSRLLQQRLSLKENDVLFLSFGDTTQKAAVAALTVALRIIGVIEPLF